MGYLFLNTLMSKGREGIGRMSPDSDGETSEPAAQEAVAKEVPKVKLDNLMGRVKTAKEYNRINAAEKSTLENRHETTPSGRLERIAEEADARAQEKLVAQNTGLFNRLSNVAKRGWEVVKGLGKIFSFVHEDVILPIKDALSDIVSGRKESGEAVGEVAQRIDTLQNQIATASPEARGALEQQLAEAQDEMAELRDPHNAARERAAREKAQEKAEQIEGKAFMKSEEERMKAEKLAADVAAAKERHREKLEREAMERDARMNLGRGAAMLIVKAAGEDPEKMSLSEGEMLAIGAVIEGAKAAIKMPETLKAGAERVKAGVEGYIDDEKAKARAAWELTRGAARGLVLADDMGEMYDNLKDAKDAAKKTIGASLSLTASALRNEPVRAEILEALGMQPDEGSGNAREILKTSLKNGALFAPRLLGAAARQVYGGVRDSEVVKDYTPAARKVGRGLKYGALGVGALVASPILLPGAGIYFGGKAAKRGYEAGKAAAGRGYDALESAAARKLMEVAPVIGEAIGPVLEDTARFINNARNAPADARKELGKIGEDLNAVLLSTAEDINTGTRKAAEAYATFAARLNAIKSAAVTIFNRLEAEAIGEAAKAKHPEVVQGIESAEDALEELELDEEVKLETNPYTAPTPRITREGNAA